MSTPEAEEVCCGLNENHLDSAYHCGRLLAIFQHLQDLSKGQSVSSYVSQFFAAASSRPAYVLTPIFRRAQHRLRQIKSGRVKADMEGLLIRVHNSIGSFPTHLTIVEQGNFQLGYFHQLPGMPDQDMRRRLPTKAGYAVKSAGEQFIANILFAHGVAHEYERPLPIPGLDKTLLPDFTVPLSGEHRLFIEYGGLSGDEDYDQLTRWKDARYRKELECRTMNDVLTDGRASKGVLMVILPDDLGNRKTAEAMIINGIKELDRLAQAAGFPA